MPGTRRGPQRLCRQLGAMQIPAANCCPAAAPCKPAARSSKPRGGFVQQQQAALGSVAASSLFPYSNAGGFWGPQHEIPQGRGTAGAQISASSPRSSRRALIAGSSSGSAGSCPEPCPEPAANAGWWQPLAPSPGLRAGESSWRRRGERCPPPPGTCCLLPRCSRCQAPHGAAFPVARCRQHRGWGFATPPPAAGGGFGRREQPCPGPVRLGAAPKNAVPPLPGSPRGAARGTPGPLSPGSPRCHRSSPTPRTVHRARLSRCRRDPSLRLPAPPLAPGAPRCCRGSLRRGSPRCHRDCPCRGSRTPPGPFPRLPPVSPPGCPLSTLLARRCPDPVTGGAIGALHPPVPPAPPATPAPHSPRTLPGAHRPTPRPPRPPLHWDASSRPPRCSRTTPNPRTLQSAHRPLPLPRFHRGLSIPVPPPPPRGILPVPPQAVPGVPGRGAPVPFCCRCRLLRRARAPPLLSLKRSVTRGAVRGPVTHGGTVEGAGGRFRRGRGRDARGVPLTQPRRPR